MKNGFLACRACGIWSSWDFGRPAHLALLILPATSQPIIKAYNQNRGILISYRISECQILVWISLPSCLQYYNKCLQFPSVCISQFCYQYHLTYAVYTYPIIISRLRPLVWLREQLFNTTWWWGAKMLVGKLLSLKWVWFFFKPTRE